MSAELANLNRTLKEISHNLKVQTRAIEAVNTNLVILGRMLKTTPESTPEENDGPADR